MKTDKDDCYTCANLSKDEGDNEYCKYDLDCQADHNFKHWSPNIHNTTNKGQ